MTRAHFQCEEHMRRGLIYLGNRYIVASHGCQSTYEVQLLPRIEKTLTYTNYITHRRKRESEADGCTPCKCAA